MFTLKLYRRHENGTRMHRVIAVHRVVVMEIGKEHTALELWVFPTAGNEYETYYVGQPEEGMEAYSRDDLHLGVDSGSWWGWGLLENSEGKTTEHYRPHNFG